MTAGRDASAAKPAAAAVQATPKPRALTISNQPRAGDFDATLKRRMTRVLVPYGRTRDFNDKGQEKGITAETVRDFERYLNKKHVTDRRPITVYLIPSTRDRMFKQVAAGIGGVAAGNLTVTDARRQTADFVVGGKQRPMAELVVTGPKSPAIATLDDLSGKTVHVRLASSYYESLTARSTTSTR